ncbi:MAG TPA: GMC family oxidoreductase [Candidatus Binataceae bacterium]|nr:GMC family oxidoreductase [Candidatus Binataceae bacterium]
MAKKHKTAIVIGSGAGGSMAARVLAKSGHFERVTVLEKGPNYFQNLGSPNFGNVKTLFSNDEIKFGARTGPQTSSDSLDNADPLLDPRRFINPSFGVNVVGEVNSLPQIVGGGLNHSDWKARRWRPADFKLKTLAERFPAHIDITGANVADWPLDYNDLEPFYTLAEYIVGVQGPAHLPSPFAPPRSKPYPMPPGVAQYVALVLAGGATKAGLHPFAAPMGVTSRPYHGRPVCNDCGFDGGFGCPIGAKSVPAITALRDALLTGKTHLMPQSYVYRLNRDGGKVASVSFFDAAGDSHEMAADVFVIAGSAIESARLCLLSGLSNPNIGRNLMFHFQTLAVGIFFPGRLHAHRGRTVTHMFDDFAGPAQIDQYAGFSQPRGGTVELAGGQPLISEAKQYLEMVFPGNPKNNMRISPLREHLAALTLQGEDLPQFSNRADLDPGLRDVFGVPVARITYQNHRYETDASTFYQPLMADVLNASAPSGAIVEVAFLGPATETSGFVPTSAHIMGTLRMGHDPATSVTDPGGKFHGIDNLYAADGSLFPTSGGMNPSLTIMALGYRVGCSIIKPHNPLSVARAIDRALL